MRYIDKKHKNLILNIMILSLFSSLAMAQKASIESTAAVNESLNNEDNILSLDIEDLLNIEVTSVGKKQQTLSDAAAAIFVITEDDIRQSGVTSIPEALRMAPGIEAAKINSSKWAISSRGFNGRAANKLLVMIDGRTVYTPSFSGVYWEVQDTVLEDIERIEVIRGPGATLWGANAVNGVINIITKNTVDTQGTLAILGGGTYEKAFSTLRHGGQINEDTYARAYIKGSKRGNNELLSGGMADDDWKTFQSGGRIDSQLNHSDRFTIQGDFYQGKLSEEIHSPILTAPYSLHTNKTTDTSGANILGRWQHAESLSSDYTLQAYYDYTSREDAATGVDHHIFDLDFNHHFSFQEHHDVVWGVGYRYIKGDYN